MKFARVAPFMAVAPLALAQSLDRCLVAGVDHQLKPAHAFECQNFSGPDGFHRLLEGLFPYSGYFPLRVA